MTTVAFFSGLLSGVVLGVLAVGELIKWTFANHPPFRDRVRQWLVSFDGYPFFVCEHCRRLSSSAPADEEEAPVVGEAVPIGDAMMRCPYCLGHFSPQPKSEDA